MDSFPLLLLPFWSAEVTVNRLPNSQTVSILQLEQGFTSFLSFSLDRCWTTDSANSFHPPVNCNKGGISQSGAKRFPSSVRTWRAEITGLADSRGVIGWHLCPRSGRFPAFWVLPRTGPKFHQTSSAPIRNLPPRPLFRGMSTGD